MTLAIQIAVGIWLGGLFLIGTIASYFAVHKWAAERLRYNRFHGYAWYHLGP